MVKNLPASAGDAGDKGSVSGWEDPLKEEMATHSSTITWKSHGQRSLVGYRPWGCKESDTTEQLSTQHRKQTEGLDALLLKTPDTIFL